MFFIVYYQIYEFYFFVYSIIKSFKKIFINYFIISNIIIYNVTLFLNILDKIT